MLSDASDSRRSPQDVRLASSSLTPASSPTDSGYGSGTASPTTPKPACGGDEQPSVSSWGHVDRGPSDLKDPFVDSDRHRVAFEDTAWASSIASATAQLSLGSYERPSTFPRRSPCSRSSLLSSPNVLIRAQQQPRSPRSYVLRRLDRFIPSRSQNQTTDMSEKFRTGKHPHELTAAERLLRHSRATEDPFCYRRRVMMPVVPELRSLPRAETAASRSRAGTVLGPLDQNSIGGGDIQVSGGTVWAVGVGGTAIDNGRGQLIRAGTNARLFRTAFPTVKPKNDEELDRYKARLAVALGLDRAERVLDISTGIHRNPCSQKLGFVPTRWEGTEWVNDGPVPENQKALGNRSLPAAPFKVLDAPNLRDDFYCTTLAFSPTSQTLAVGLGNYLYGWSEARGVRLLNAGTDADCHLTSLSFSSAEGCKSILAFGRSNGTLGLLSLYDDSDPESRSAPTPRFEVVQLAPIACVSWKPVCTLRPSKSRIHPGILVKTEDLLVGDDTGLVYYYAVEWPERWEVERHNWAGKMTLLARVAVHSQQICGLAWSQNGELFGTGGNDNLCCLFETFKVLEAHLPGPDDRPGLQVESATTAHVQVTSSDSEADTKIQTSLPVRHLGPGDEKHRWVHGAAVKAIAFCPWQETLVATGGGSNDKCIHFFHTRSGAALASISVAAQVTSLIWSTTRREIAATFGYAHPDHPVRIAVFSWPECRQVAAIPWAGEHRALYAVPYPCDPEDARSRQGRRGGRARGCNRSAKDGCIMVASSDKSVKFHEVWAADTKATAGRTGILGGSPILEFLEGIYTDSEVVR